MRAEIIFDDTEGKPRLRLICQSQADKDILLMVEAFDNLIFSFDTDLIEDPNA